MMLIVGIVATLFLISAFFFGEFVAKLLLNIVTSLVLGGITWFCLVVFVHADQTPEIFAFCCGTWFVLFSLISMKRS